MMLHNDVGWHHPVLCTIEQSSRRAPRPPPFDGKLRYTSASPPNPLCGCEEFRCAGSDLHRAWRGPRIVCSFSATSVRSDKFLGPSSSSLPPSRLPLPHRDRAPEACIEQPPPVGADRVVS